MTHTYTASVGARGVLVIPKALRTRFGIEDGSLLLLQEKDGCFVARPAVAMPVEKYTNERKAEFLLNSAADANDYAEAVKAVIAMGLNPESIPHDRPE